MNKKIILLTLFLALIFISNIPLGSAQSITVTKITPEDIKQGEILTVVINIKNNGNEQVQVTVIEQYGNAEAIEPKPIVPTTPEGMIAARPPYFKWTVTLEGNSEKKIEYKIKPLTVGDYTFSPTVVETSDGQKFYSNTPITHVKCSPNGMCEVDKGENYFTCSDDCSSGSSDNICDMIRDGKCDPDCTKESDLDCYCGDGTCQNFENYKTCSKDCQVPISSNYLIIMAVIIVISVITFILIKLKRKKK
jgi:hypothetical protein